MEKTPIQKRVNDHLAMIQIREKIRELRKGPQSYKSNIIIQKLEEEYNKIKDKYYTLISSSPN